MPDFRCQAPGCLCDAEDRFWPTRLLCEACWTEARAKKWQPAVRTLEGDLVGWVDMSGKLTVERDLNGKEIKKRPFKSKPETLPIMRKPEPPKPQPKEPSQTRLI